MSASRRLAGTALLVLAATGCGGASEAPPSDVAHYEAEGSGSDAALLPGRLVREGGCTYLVDESDVRWVPAFPDEGISWSDDELVVGSARYPLDTRVELGGGEGSRSGTVLPDGCDEDAQVWRVAPA